MTIAIPTWVLWTLGAVVGLPLAIIFCMCACVGASFLWHLKDWRWP